MGGSKKMKKLYFLSTSLLTLLIFGTINSLQAQITKISIAYPALSPAYTNLWVSKEAGLFDKYGLDVTLVLMGGGLRITQSLIAGDISFAGGGGEAALVANLKGADTTIIATNQPVLTYKLIGKKIRSLEELKRAVPGVRLGILSFGSTSDFVARKITAALGLIVGKQILLVPSGEATGRLAALSQGLIDLTLMTTALPTRMSRGGFHILLNTATAEPPFPYHGGGLSTKREMIRRNPGIVSSVMKAYVEGIKIYKTDREFALKVGAKYTRRSNMDELQEEWKEYVDVVPKAPYPAINGIKAMLGDLSGSFPETSHVDIRRFFDDSFVRDLELSGFINNLYKPDAK